MELAWTGLDHSIARQDVDARLALLLHRGRGQGDLLNGAMQYALLGSGKRIRPLLTIAAAASLGTHSDAALDAGCALEMVHAASLILDDLPSMDNATLRRGKAVTHLAFGEDLAILASISLLTRAFEVLASLAQADAHSRAEMVCILARAAGACGLSGGQMDDLRSGEVPSGHVGLYGAEQAAAVNQLKTGTLFVAAVEMAATLAAATATEREALRGFADALGLAFQLRDDLLDGDSPSALTGKDFGQDADKPNLVALLGRDAAGQRLGRHVEDALRCLHPLGSQAGPLRRLVAATFAQPPDFQVAADALILSSC